MRDRSGSEAGLRRVNKKLESEEIFAAAPTPKEGGLSGLKALWLAGFAHETTTTSRPPPPC